MMSLGGCPDFYWYWDKQLPTLWPALHVRVAASPDDNSREAGGCVLTVSPQVSKPGNKKKRKFAI